MNSVHGKQLGVSSNFEVAEEAPFSLCIGESSRGSPPAGEFCDSKNRIQETRPPRSNPGTHDACNCKGPLQQRIRYQTKGMYGNWPDAQYIRKGLSALHLPIPEELVSTM